MKNSVLVIGSGGREHAFVWAFSKDDNIEKIYCAPGNAGTASICENVDLNISDHEEITNFVLENDISLTLVGPEIPLAEGIVDSFSKLNLPIFGPDKFSSQLESSKIFARDIMHENNIPQPTYFSCSSIEEAHRVKESIGLPLVLKVDGLAAGKGVIICHTEEDFNHGLIEIFKDNVFGDAGSRISVEEFLEGDELSVFAVCDGENFIILNTAQDHKRIYDDDKGPNTGGMGAYSPTPVIDDKLSNVIQEEIIAKTISSMSKEGIEFRGFLYAGIMIRDGKPYVLEYNVRMGDPECQPILMRLNSDLYKYLKASSEGKLNNLSEISWKDESAVCIVLASNGYPNSYPKGDEISGFDNIPQDSFVFHAGTKNEDGKIVSNGGRVLGITALGSSLNDAINNAYNVAKKIHWENKYQRNDIGKKGLSYL